MRGITCSYCYKLLLLSDYPSVAEKTIEMHVSSHFYAAEEVETFDE